jgi:hypothetical protein
MQAASARWLWFATIAEFTIKVLATKAGARSFTINLFPPGPSSFPLAICNINAIHGRNW